MYKGIIRPILFLLDPERVHHLVVFLVKILYSVPGARLLMRKVFTYNHPVLTTKIGSLTFKNKVGMAAGFDKNAAFFEPFAAFGFSFIEIGTVTPLAQTGNPKPRLFRLPKDKALINRMGFNNEGAAVAAKRLKNRKQALLIGGNIGKNTATPNEKAAADYLACFRELYDVVDYFTVNVSCPNIKDLGKLQDQDSLREILTGVMNERRDKTVKKPVFLKISPDLTYRHIDEIIDLYFETGLDGIIATNTTTDRQCLQSQDTYVTSIGTGGMSGLPLKKRSLEIVSYICNKSDHRIPVIGVGGILTPEDAVDMIKAGAILVQLYTGFIYEGPFIVRRCNKAIADYLTGLQKSI